MHPAPFRMAILDSLLSLGVVLFQKILEMVYSNSCAPLVEVDRDSNSCLKNIWVRFCLCILHYLQDEYIDVRNRAAKGLYHILKDKYEFPTCHPNWFQALNWIFDKCFSLEFIMLQEETQGSVLCHSLVSFIRKKTLYLSFQVTDDASKDNPEYMIYETCPSHVIENVLNQWQNYFHTSSMELFECDPSNSFEEPLLQMQHVAVLCRTILLSSYGKSYQIWRRRCFAIAVNHLCFLLSWVFYIEKREMIGFLPDFFRPVYILVLQMFILDEGHETYQQHNESRIENAIWYLQKLSKDIRLTNKIHKILEDSLENFLYWHFQRSRPEEPQDLLFLLGRKFQNSRSVLSEGFLRPSLRIRTNNKSWLQRIWKNLWNNSDSTFTRYHSPSSWDFPTFPSGNRSAKTKLNVHSYQQSMKAPLPPSALPSSRSRAARYRTSLMGQRDDADLYTPINSSSTTSLSVGLQGKSPKYWLDDTDNGVDNLDLEADEVLEEEDSLEPIESSRKRFQWHRFWKKLGQRSFWKRKSNREEEQDRIISLASIDRRQPKSQNRVRNQQYNIFNFFPKILFEEFRMFYNLFFLGVALSQLIPPLRVNYLFTYLGPLIFVLSVSISKKVYDDWQRYCRDREVNMQTYTRLLRDGSHGTIYRKDIGVGDVLILHNDDRVPADCLLLKAKHDSKGTIFIRTDQLDGETDWKLRRAVSSTQTIEDDKQLVGLDAFVHLEAPRKEIYDFVGNLSISQSEGSEEKVYIEEPLSLENTIWANTVIASGSAVVLVLYVGEETRSALNASKPKSKVGKLDWELNRISKMLFFFLGSMSFVLLVLKGFQGRWYLYFMRYFLLFSSIIPISMRINLDMARTIYSYFIQHDQDLHECIVRSSNLPEELGRIDYLLSDKTGTLTKNEMHLKKLHLGSLLFSKDDLEDLRKYVLWGFTERADKYSLGNNTTFLSSDSLLSSTGSQIAHPQSLRHIQTAISQTLLAIAIAHHVTPFIEEDGTRTIQAASPDEVALVNFCEECGVILLERSASLIRLRTPTGAEEQFEILCEFPFTSAARRMGIVVRDLQTMETVFYVKGADMIIAQLVHENDWLDEESGNLAREGLRTLAYAKKTLGNDELEKFMKEYQAAQRTIKNRSDAISAVQRSLEKDMEVIALTGVEDKLQDGVRETIEKLQHAGIRIWMLTGDKVETATNIAVSSRLVQRSKGICTMTGVSNQIEASRQLSLYRHRIGDVLIVDGPSLQTLLTFCREEFLQLSCLSPCVVVCRCSPTQKSLVVRLVQSYTSSRVAAIGDGGNDVSMIQQANFGIGIPGKEGKQASLASDIGAVCHSSRTYYCHHSNGLLRNFLFYAAIPIFEGWILVGYATIYTMFPVFSLILDVDVTKEIAFTYPELYADLRKGRSLNLKTFLTWLLKGLYQGMTIMVVSVYVLWNDEYFSTTVEIRKWHRLMVVAECISLISYGLSLFLLRTVFDLYLILRWSFWLRILIVTTISCCPVVVAKFINRKCAPPSYSKLI
ncbi:Probable phospholipid-transporting ATPase IIB [Galdieria sulphuraria]|nr:Probable phospholipid-transporting ATPase IIB [Galdieria sulphuraria]